MKKYLYTFITILIVSPFAFAQIHVNSAGDVGIGITTPFYKLDVLGNAIVRGTQFSSFGDSANIYLGDGANRIQNLYGTGLQFISYPGTTPSLTIRSGSGNIGIGTTTPSAALDLEGAFQLKDGTEGTNRILTSDADGNSSWQKLSAETIFGSAVDANFDCLETVASLGLAGTPNSIIINETKAYICAGSNLQIVDIQNPTAPSVLGSITFVSPKIYNVYGGYAYLLDGSNLVIVDVSTPSSPTSISTFPLGATYSSLAACGNYAYVCRTISNSPSPDTGELKVIDITNKVSPTLATTFALSYRATKIKCKGNYVYIGGGYTPGSPTSSAAMFGAYDVSIPGAPVETFITSLSVSLSTVHNLTLSENKVILSHGQAASQILSIFSLANPAIPSSVGGNGAVSQPVDLAATDSYVFAVEFADIRIYNGVTGSFIKYKNIPDTCCFSAIAVKENFLYALNPDKLVVINLSCTSTISIDPLTSQLSSTTALWQAKGNNIYNINTANVGIGTSSPAGKLDVAGNIYQNGSLIHSDRRYKMNITNIENALDKIKQLQGTKYSYNVSGHSEMNFKDGEVYGFIAQDLKEVLPELVVQGRDNYYAVNYDGVIPVLTEAIKEQQKLIEEQQKQIAELQNESANSINIAALLQRLEVLEYKLKVKDLDN